MKRITILFLFFLLACSAQKKVPDEVKSRTRIKVIELKEVEYAYVLKGINTSTSDTLSIISFKGPYYQFGNNKDFILNNVREINIGNSYLFNLSKPQRVKFDPVTHYKMIVLNKDTIWQGNDYKGLPYFSANSKGLLIKED